MQVVLGFELTPATALSHTIVATSAVASSIYGLIATSPNDPRRSLIDWDLTIFIPALLIGVSIGTRPLCNCLRLCCTLPFLDVFDVRS